MRHISHVTYRHGDLPCSVQRCTGLPLATEFSLRAPKHSFKLASAFFMAALLLLHPPVVVAAKVTQGSSTYTILDEVRSKYPELVDLLLKSESLDSNEKQYWFDILPSMTDQQIDRLFKILMDERRRLEILGINYQMRIAALNCKHALQWVRLQEREASKPPMTDEKKRDLLSGCSVIDQQLIPDELDDPANQAKNAAEWTKQANEIRQLATAAPKLEWLTAEREVFSRTTQLRVALTDKGGGFGAVELMVDGVRVGARGGRNLVVASKDGVARDEHTFELELPEGRHEVEVIAYGRDNAVNTARIKTSVVSRYRASSKPRLFALVVGINDYQNGQLALRHARKDAEAVAEKLRAQIEGGRIYSGGQVQLMTGVPGTSKRSILEALEKMQGKAEFNDVFVLYVAGHGINYKPAKGSDIAGYYVLTSDVLQTSQDRIATSSISAAELQRLVAGIASGKKILLLDTCNSGKSLSAEDIVASRGLEEQRLVEMMRDRSGASVLAASETAEQAYEGFRGHGVFTYALLEAFGGSADSNRDGVVSTDELKIYLEERVPEITQLAFKTRQTPRPSVAGQGFPLLVVKP